MLKTMLKSLAVAAAVAGVLAAAPPASAAPASPASAATAQTSDGMWPAGNCPQGVFCLWPEWNEWMTPALTTNTDWSGEMPGYLFYNNTSRNVDITFRWQHDSPWGPFTICLTPGNGQDTYWPGIVTNVKVHTQPCVW
ncbi:hypothetical protein [Verrucosispora sp. ts21]|uniref:hypothetical protein n=1 Tax=Verrucosispora sp. ts21 TaxID=2069341 RepID=UPI001E3A513B|nr:hypothetical protein [Verrucosispora sp. ts21]